MGLKDRLMPLYRRAPPVLRDLVSSAYGLQLVRWRYGPETPRLTEEALARDRWDRDEWSAWSRERVAELLTRAAEDVPYYREAWAKRRAEGDRSDVAALDSWPVLTKAELRANPTQFLRDDANPRKLFKLSTSGTSGTPVQTWRSRTGLRTWYALAEARWRRWYGVSRGDPWAIVGGQEVVPVERDRPPFWVFNAANRQLYLSNLHIKREHAHAYVRALWDHGVVHIYAYTSSLASLARHILDLGIEAPRLKVVVTNAEPVTPQQRRLIETAFSCPVRESYGMSEEQAAASECEHGVMHLWPDAGHVEVLRDDSPDPVAPGETGRLICTGLVHLDMPLIRYEVGDRGAVIWPQEPCACGRAMPHLASLEGRTTDNLVTTDGRSVFWINPVFYGLPLHEAQVVQEELGRIVVNVVPEPAFGETDERSIKEGLRRRLGDVAVELRKVDAITRGPNGKFKAVVSKVSMQGDARVDDGAP